MKNKKFLLVAICSLILVLGFLVSAKVYKTTQTKKLSFLSETNAKLFVPEHAVRLGAEEPQVYLVEFLDPECESCRQFAPLVKSIMNEFEGKIQLVVRYAPFHGNSIFVIKILEAARFQGKYWETLDILFQHQPEWGSHHAPNPELVWKYLPEAGVDVERIRNEMNNPMIQEIIKQDQLDGQALQVSGTPTFFVNGKPLEDFGYEPLRQMVAAELKD